MKLDASIPDGPLAEKWDRHIFAGRIISPANRRKYRVIVVGTGLAGSAAAATLAELGYDVQVFTMHDTPRRAHSIAAQGGINAAKNYANDGDSIFRLFYDTIKGGDFRAREANVYRLAQISNRIIDHCVAQGVPFAREYGGGLANRSFGGAQVSRTFYARGQTGQQLLLGAYGALMRQARLGRVTIHPRQEMLDLVTEDNRARGIVCRDMRTGAITSHAGHVVVLATGGYGNVYYLSTNAMSSNVTAAWRAHRKGALFANPCFVQIHPTCIPVHDEQQCKLTLMSESLRNDGRVWVPKNAGDTRPPAQIPESERDYYLENKYPGFGNLVPRDVASRNAKQQCDQNKGVGEAGLAVYLDFADAVKRDGLPAILRKYGNLFQMYEKITAHDPAVQPMMIYPAVHYSMGGLWVDYNLMSTLPGLYVLGEANFSDHGANRLGASALMQGLADGYFILPNTIGRYLADCPLPLPDTTASLFTAETKKAESFITKLLAVKGKRTTGDIHRQLGRLLWDECGLLRNGAGLGRALAEIPAIREEFWKNVLVPGTGMQLNQSLERAGRLADYLEFAELMVRDALDREESCGCHLREENQTEDNEARRDDANFCHVSAWEYRGEATTPVRHREPLVFDNVTPSQRSYR
ncbi:MAG: fumarate reductase/succinate dehydrogenase flavoprotein subunit [Deltaproteobacteria bacterium]|nr:fumarate reductase/succinate dehydrogenase flavoprotein subunit [Deltaproteobacteria bacterium]